MIAILGSSYGTLPFLLQGAALWAALALLEVYPPCRTRVRSLAGTFGPVFFFVYAAFFLSTLYGYWTGKVAFTLSVGVPSSWLLLASMTVFGVAIIDAIATAPAEYRTPTRWLGVSWLVGVLLVAIPNICFLLQMYPVLESHYLDALRAAEVFFFCFGVAYPVLRHRLVDVNILVTRATVFAAVSIIIVAIFIAAEWSVGRIFEHSMGVLGGRGFGPQMATLAIVLALGISTRPIHRFVEERLTQMFFRKRIKGLAEITRLAKEADSATDASAIMDLACRTVERQLEPLGVACYLRSGDSYVLACSFGGATFPPAYAFNDAAPLRLRRWQETFEIDDDSDDRYHMLFLPMMLRGEVLGFFACGPKPDRTPYLEDERSALSLLAHQVGIAAAWLERPEAAPAHLSLVES